IGDGVPRVPHRLHSVRNRTAETLQLLLLLIAHQRFDGEGTLHEIFAVAERGGFDRRRVVQKREGGEDIPFTLLRQIAGFVAFRLDGDLHGGGENRKGISWHYPPPCPC